MSTPPYYKLKAEQRTAEGRKHVGRLVRLTIGTGYIPQRTVVGVLWSAAYLDHGTTTDVLVIRRSGETDQAFSGAQVRSIEPIV